MEIVNVDMIFIGGLWHIEMLEKPHISVVGAVLNL